MPLYINGVEYDGMAINGYEINGAIDGKVLFSQSSSPSGPSYQKGKGILHVTWAGHFQQDHPVQAKDFQLAPGTYNWLDMFIPDPEGYYSSVSSRYALINPGSVDPRHIVIKPYQTTVVNLIVVKL